MFGGGQNITGFNIGEGLDLSRTDMEMGLDIQEVIKD